MDMKICTHCNQNKHIKDFYKKNNTTQSWCKTCTLSFQKKRWKSRKYKAVSLLGGKCKLCGYNKCIYALEFHHKDPKEKEFSWNKMKLKSWEKIIIELKKCILLCSNCHKELHYKNDFDYNLNNDNNRLNVKDIQSTGKCPQCNKEVYGTKFCSTKCSSLSRRKVSRPKKKTLKNKLETMSWASIGKEYGVSDNAVRKWAKYYDLI
jgi:hypothetical protein